MTRPFPIETPTSAGPLRLEAFFEGRTEGWGVFQDPFGVVRRRYSMVFEGVRDGEALNLTEDFHFDDGGRERRVWRITPTADGGAAATADDLVGTAVGQATGDRFVWRYLFDLSLGSRRLRVRFSEWFERAGPDLLINRARVSKWGVPIGSTTIVFRKVRPTIARQAGHPALAA